MDMIRNWLRREDGGVTLYVAVLMSVLLAAGALIVDGSSKMRTGRAVTAIANEAARAASQHLDGSAITGRTGKVDTAAGAAAARAMLRDAGADGTVSVSGSTVRVTAQASWSPTFYGAIVPAQTLTATATASPERR